LENFYLNDPIYKKEIEKIKFLEKFENLNDWGFSKQEGKIYQDLLKSDFKNLLLVVLILSIDGINIFKSSKKELYPLSLINVLLPPSSIIK
jgi:hypothetical protein